MKRIKLIVELEDDEITIIRKVLGQITDTQFKEMKLTDYEISIIHNYLYDDLCKNDIKFNEE